MTKATTGESGRGNSFAVDVRELSGALGDLGTLLPLMLGAFAIGGLAPIPVLMGFALFYIGTALYYRLPIPVQPMKAVAAVLLTAELSPNAVVATGVLAGVALLLLGVTGWIERLARLVPQSVLAGLQLGLGLVLAIASVGLMAKAPLVAIIIAILIGGFMLVPALPAALLALAAAIALGQMLPPESVSPWVKASTAMPQLMFFSWHDIERAISIAVLPQLSLTFMNAIVLTALLARDYFADRAAHVTPVRLSITTGIANLLLTPFGALPMCHGAGGLAAHYRFGARSGTAPLAIGVTLMVLALLPHQMGLAILDAIPLAAVGVLLLVAAGELALTKRLFDSKPSCWPVIAITAAVTVWADPFWALCAGSLAELVRIGILGLLARKSRVDS